MLALPIGIYSAVRQYSVRTISFTFIGFIGIAVPNFMLALIVLYVSFKYLNAQSVGGFVLTRHVAGTVGLAQNRRSAQHLPLPARHIWAWPAWPK